MNDIKIESSLLKAMSKRSNYEYFIQHIDKQRLLDNTRLVLNDYEKYFKSFEHIEIDWQNFITEFSQHWHNSDLDADDIKYYTTTVIEAINNAEDKSVSSVLLALLDRKYSEIIQGLISNDINPDLISDELNNYRKERSKYIKENDEDIFTLDSVDCSILDTSNGIEWFLGALQAGLGGLMPGQFIVVSADSGTGKSAFCISQAVKSFKNSKKVLYCTSEDTKEDLTARFLSNLYCDQVRGGFESIVKNWEKVVANFKETYSPGLFVGMQINSPHDMFKIQQKIDTYKPDVVIIDMLDCLSKDLGHESLTLLYNKVRAIANSGYPVIGTTQSGNTTFYDKKNEEHKYRKWLSDKDMAGSKFGKQGAAYCSIMIGKDDNLADMRYINTTKKKRGQHVKVTCEIIEKFSLYKELI